MGPPWALPRPAAGQTGGLESGAPLSGNPLPPHACLTVGGSPLPACRRRQRAHPPRPPHRQRGRGTHPAARTTKPQQRRPRLRRPAPPTPLAPRGAQPSRPRSWPPQCSSLPHPFPTTTPFPCCSWPAQGAPRAEGAPSQRPHSTTPARRRRLCQPAALPALSPASWQEAPPAPRPRCWAPRTWAPSRHCSTPRRRPPAAPARSRGRWARPPRPCPSPPWRRLLQPLAGLPSYWTAWSWRCHYHCSRWAAERAQPAPVAGFVQEACGAPPLLLPRWHGPRPCVDKLRRLSPLAATDRHAASAPPTGVMLTACTACCCLPRHAGRAAAGLRGAAPAARGVPGGGAARAATAAGHALRAGRHHGAQLGAAVGPAVSPHLWPAAKRSRGRRGVPGRAAGRLPAEPDGQRAGAERRPGRPGRYLQHQQGAVPR